MKQEFGFIKRVDESGMGPFRITIGLFFKARPDVHPFILVAIQMQMQTNYKHQDSL